MATLLIEPVRQRIAIAVSPKVACVSLRMWLWHLGHGREWDGSCIFQEFHQHTLGHNQLVPSSVVAIIAVHRDGISRLRACYDHRVVREREAPDQGLVHFARHLPEYCALFPAIAHHVVAQSHYLGSVQEAYTDIIPLSRLSILKEIVEEAIGVPVPELPVHHRTEKPSAVDEEVRHWFGQWTAHDTAIGWNGETLRIGGETIADKRI
jgi:hypothetical protein